MTDLHSHILPGVDDGAQNIRISLELLRRQYADGVTQIALTPHFHFGEQTTLDFLRKRTAAARQLAPAFRAAKLPQRIRMGAEVFYSSQLAEADLRPLCLAGTNLLLIEFHPSYFPAEAPNVLYQLTRLGIVPLIAHVERYLFVRENPNVLCDLIESGVYTQMNATSLTLHKKHRPLLVRMIRSGLVHVLSTDTHSPEKRPPMLGEAFELVAAECGAETVRRMKKTADALFRGETPARPEPHEMRRIFGAWR